MQEQNYNLVICAIKVFAKCHRLFLLLKVLACLHFFWIRGWSTACNSNSITKCLILQLRRPPLNIFKCIKLRTCEFSLTCFATVNCILNVGEMMGHHSFNDKAAVLIRRPYKCPSTLKALKCLYSANVLLTVTEVYTPWGTRLEFTKSYNCSFHLREKNTSRGSILVNIGQLISRTFSLYNVYVIKNKTVVANFFGNTNVFK